MNCTCGWTFDESTDWICSGCGKRLRWLELLGDRKQYILYYGKGAMPLTVPILNRGELPVSITKQWELINLYALKCRLDGQNTPTVELFQDDEKEFEVEFDGSRMPFTQSGILRVHAGIAPPLDTPVSCMPVPELHFKVNNKLVRDNAVRTFVDPAKGMQIDFLVEVANAREVSWTQFRLFVKDNQDRTVSVASGHSFPVLVKEGHPYTYSVATEEVLRGAEFPAYLTAEFFFEKCHPETFRIEVVERARIIDAQDIKLINKDALIIGKSRPREIGITLSNAGGLHASVLKLVSMSEPWLEIRQSLDNRALEPKGASKGNFCIAINPEKINETDIQKYGSNAADGSILLNGVISISYKEHESNEILDIKLNVGVELRPPEEAFYVAVDFGNTNTCVSFYNFNGNKYETVSLDSNSPEDVLEFPTIIDFDEFSEPDTEETGKGFKYGYIIGKTKYAVGSEGNNLDHRIWHFKRKLGTDISAGRLDRKNRLRKFTSEQLTGFFMKEVITRFEERTGHVIESMVITYPANFFDYQKQSLRRAVQSVRPEIDVITEISEPEALALDYFRKRELGREQELFAVFDFGGGSTDITVGLIWLQDNVRKIKVLLSIGLDQLGGDLLTFELARDIYNRAYDANKGRSDNIEEFFPQTFDDIFLMSSTEKEKRFNFMNLMNKAEEIKTDKDNQYKYLQREGEISIHIPDFYFIKDQPEPSVISYNAENFNNVAKPMISMGFKKLKGMLDHLKEHNIINEEMGLDFLILGGNSSRLPLVRTLAADIVGLPEGKIFFNGENTKTGVALGAAFYGMQMDHPKKIVEFDNSFRLKFPVGIRNPEGSFEVLFPAGSEAGRSVPQSWRAVRRMQFWQNHDPSNRNIDDNPEAKPVAVCKLTDYARPGQMTKFKLVLTEKGIMVSTNNSNESSVNKPGLLEISW